MQDPNLEYIEEGLFEHCEGPSVNYDDSWEREDSWQNVDQYESEDID